MKPSKSKNSYKCIDRLWVVVCEFKTGEWGICNFTKLLCSSTNYFQAYQFKKELYKYLKKHGSSTWRKKDFKVVEFVIK